MGVAPDFGGYFCILPEFHDIITNSASPLSPLDFCSVDEGVKGTGNDSRYVTVGLELKLSVSQLLQLDFNSKSCCLK